MNNSPFSPLLTDFYELTMIQGFIREGKQNQIAVFDLFYRSNPFGNGYAIAAGLAQVIEYINGLTFSDDNIEFFKSLNKFDDAFIDYIKNFKFTGDIYAVPEGSVVFPNEPLIKIIAPLAQAHLIEGALLNIINHQSLIATKASRIVEAAKSDPVMEFGLRRAQGSSAAVYGARAAIIGGLRFTSNVEAAKKFDLPLAGTHSHSWVMSFPNELEAFSAYAKNNESNCLLLVDTYNTLKSGLPNAIKIFDQLKNQRKLNKYGIRLDSGDLAYLSKKSRIMLDESGHKEAIIAASNDLDENLIRDLKDQGATINLWGVGTNLITSYNQPSFGGVYKLAGIYSRNLNNNGKPTFYPKIKLSDTPEKINNPGDKKIIRIYDKKTRKMKASLLCLAHENIDEKKNLTLFHPVQTWKKMKLEAGSYETKDMLIKIFDKGKQVYTSPNALQIQTYCELEKLSLWDEFKRLTNPHIFPVDLSQELYDLKHSLIDSIYNMESQ